jgi:hypothetical protein
MDGDRPLDWLLGEQPDREKHSKGEGQTYPARHDAIIMGEHLRSLSMVLGFVHDNASA